MTPEEEFAWNTQMRINEINNGIQVMKNERDRLYKVLKNGYGRNE